MDKKKVIELIKSAKSKILNIDPTNTELTIKFSEAMYDLNIAIKELQKIDWISVEDELPPYDEEVFVADIANPKGVWRTYRTKEKCPEKDKNDFSCPIGFTITHWISIKLEV